MMKRLLWIVLVFWSSISHASSEDRNYFPDPVDSSQIITIAPDKDFHHLHFKGNTLIHEKAFKNQISNFSKRAPTKSQLNRIVKKLEAFYHKIGFVLANVTYEPDDSMKDGWIIRIDEGLLDSINIFGLNWYETFKFRRSVLAQNTYNEKTLKHKLERMRSDKFEEISYELVDLGERKPTILTKITYGLSSMLISNKELLTDKKLRRYGLNVYFKGVTKVSSIRYSFDYSSNFGPFLKGEYDKSSLFFKQDEFYAMVGLGVKHRKSIDPARIRGLWYPSLQGQITWYSPPTTDEKFRFYIDADAFYNNEQRFDLPLDKYSFLHVRPALFFEYQMAKNKFFYTAVGYDYRMVDAKEVVTGNVYTISKNSSSSVLARVGFELTFGRPKLINSYNHKLDMFYSFYFRGKSDFLSEVKVQYSKTSFSQMTEFHFKAAGLALFQDIQFYDEFYLKELNFRSTFGNRFFVRKGAGVSMEARIDVYGKKVQVGVFDDLAVFEHFNEGSNSSEAVVANSVGAGGYFLLYDAIQIYATYSFGLTSTGASGHDVAVGLKKLF